MAPAAALSLLIPNVIPKISPESGMKLHKFPGKLYIKICGGTTFASKGVLPRPFRKPVGEKAFFVLSAMRPRPGEKIWETHSCGQEWVPRALSKKAIGNDIGFELSGNLSISF